MTADIGMGVFVLSWKYESSHFKLDFAKHILYFLKLCFIQVIENFNLNNVPGTIVVFSLIEIMTSA